MKTVRVWFVDFWNGCNPKELFIYKILEKKYELILDEQNPEIVFCSIFGKKFLNYKCVRVVYCGEPQTPDFNIYDYAIGFDHIQFLDRYVRYPLYLANKELYSLAITKHERALESAKDKTGFCSFVVSAGGGEGDVRTRIFDKLSEYKTVASGGKYRNNLPDGKPVPDKLKFQKDYKFALALENSKVSGYTTEKIIDAWAAGCIPIYWGNPDIALEFNSEAFINANDYSSIDELVEAVKKVDQDDALYMKMCQAPILNEQSDTAVSQDLSRVKKSDYEESLEIFLDNIIENKKILRSSAFTQWGRIYEYNIAKLVKIESNGVVSAARKVKRKLFGLKKI